MISAAEFAAYNREVAKIGDRAAADVESSVLAWCRSHEDATVAEKREAAKLIMEGFVQGYDDVAAEFAAQWYDHRAEQSGARLEQAVTMTTYGPDSVDAVARYQARKLAKGGDAAFAKACGEFARNDAFRSLNETIAANVGRDKDKGVRFARVPTGLETCTFCLMLASRGAVYHTRKTAGELKRFHRNCDCKIVPGFEGDKDAELVEGVRPKELVRKWWLFEKIDATEGLSSAERNEMKRLVLDGGELPEKVRKTNPTAHMRKVGRSSSGWISAGERLDREVKARGFRDVSDFYEYLESRRTAAEIVEAGVLGEKILDNADATPKFHELVKGHLRKSVELVDGVSPKELREWSKRLKKIDGYGLPSFQEDALKHACLDRLDAQTGGQRRASSELSELFEAARRDAWNRFAKEKTERNYEETFGRFVRLLGEEYGATWECGSTRNVGGTAVYANPNGDELWVAAKVSSYERSLKFLPSDQDVVPDVETSSGYAEIKCPSSAKKTSARLRHAKAQLDAMGSGGKTTYLGLQKINDVDRARAIAADMQSEGSAVNVWCILPDGQVVRP